MEIAVIVSGADPAGMNILGILEKQDLIRAPAGKEPHCSQEPHLRGLLAYPDSRKHCGQARQASARLYTVSTEPVYCENIDREIEADLFIFATKHASKSGVPCLSVHVQGNWSESGLGGKMRELCIAPCLYLRQAMLLLMKNSAGPSGYEVIQECTHHGPYLDKPSMFIEIGSTEREWEDSDAGAVVARTIAELAFSEPERAECAFGIGGLHHTPNFRKLLDKGIALGHVCPKYMLEALDEAMVRQALERSAGHVKHVILDWKGLGKEKQRIVGMLDKMGIRYRKISDFN